MEEQEIENILIGQKIQSYLGIISYVLLIFITVFIGFDIFKGLQIGNIKVSQKTLNRIASMGLVCIWIILMTSEIIRLKRIN